MSMKSSNDIIESRSNNHSVCSALHPPAASPLAPTNVLCICCGLSVFSFTRSSFSQLLYICTVQQIMKHLYILVWSVSVISLLMAHKEPVPIGDYSDVYWSYSKTTHTFIMLDSLIYLLPWFVEISMYVDPAVGKAPWQTVNCIRVWIIILKTNNWMTAEIIQYPVPVGGFV